MIAMVESGRLGNQIFQYAALRSVAKRRETLLLLGFDQLRSTFDGVDARFVTISTSPLRHLATLDYGRLGRVAAVLPGVGMIDEDEVAHARRETRAAWAVARPSWFQSAGVLQSRALASLSVKRPFVDRARAFLSDVGMHPSSTAFVHVRAGDYRTWPSPEHPAILSAEWYRSRIDEMRASRPELAVVAIGDEAAYTDEVISNVPDAVAYRADEASEFALMTICGAGILSASSFAYWGAYFAKRADPAALMLGPQYWAGHAQRRWYPPNIAAPFIDYR